MKKSIILIILLLLILIGLLVFAKTDTFIKLTSGNTIDEIIEKEPEPELPKEEVDIIDINSDSRPYALVVNNTAVAVKVQEGLNKAYLIYEIPTEGNTSRLLAFYKDIDEDLVVGTIRSCRHNFIDFALESDAILCCFGWSHYAEDDLKAGSINYLQGLYGYPFYRKNPEKLATEHTAYTSFDKLKDQVKKKKFRTTSDDSVLLNYNVSDTDLALAENMQEANTITIPYGAAPQIASFKYDEETKMYTRFENGKECIDHQTKESVTTKNIIVQKINYKMCSDNYYWDLSTIGNGKGYFITNGYAVPIKWSKSVRKAKTMYTYAEGTIIDGKDVSGKEIEVSDGRTWIEVQTNSQKLTIE